MSGTTYTLKRSARARALRIAVHPDGSVVVTAPHSSGIPAIERFVDKHSAWIQKHIARAKRRTVLRINKKEIPALKKRARLIAQERVGHFAASYGFAYGAISIRPQKTRWGSCSHKGNLSFNYKIAALPQCLVDYIVVHEVCHLQALDHSRTFWDLVARTVPEYAARRKELRNIATMYE